MRQEYEQWFAEKFGHPPMPLDSRQIDFCWHGYQAGVESMRQQLAEANHAHEFMSQQYLDALKKRNQLRKDVAKLQEALNCKLTWKPS